MASKTQIKASQLTGSMPSSSTSASAAPAITDLAGVLDHLASSISRIHGASVFSNSAAGVFAQDILPDADGSRDLGSTTAEFAEVHANSVLSQVAMAITAADGDLSVTADGSDNKVVIKGDHTSGAAIHLDGNAAAGSIVDIDAGVLDMDATGAATLDAGGAITLTGAGILLAGGSSEIDITNSGALDINAGSVDLDSTAGIAMDGTTVSIDGTDDSNVTVTGSAKDLDIAVAGGGTQELRLASAGTGASALHLNASAGGINIDSADMIDIDAADEITIDTTSADGHIAITSAHTAGDAIVISANAHAGSILDVDAGVMDVDVQAGFTLDASGISLDSDAASNLSTSSGDLDISSAAELDLDGATVKLDSAGQMDLTAVAALNLISAAYDVNASGVVGIDSDAAMTLGGSSIAATADGGALSLTTTDVAGDISLVSAHTAGVAFHIDANANAASEVQIDAGILDIDVTGAATLDAGGAIGITGAGVDINAGSSTLELHSTGAVDVNSAGFTLDASTVSIDGTDDSNITMTADASGDKTLSITASNSGGGDGLMVLTADTVTIAGNLDVNGTTTTIDTTNMAVDDKNIVLSRGNATSGVLDAAGFTIEGGSGDDITLQQLASGDRFELKKGSAYHPMAVGKLLIDGANDHIDVSTDMIITAAADVKFAAGGGNVLPSTDDGAALGTSAIGWSDLFLAEGAVINFDDGDFTMTQTNNLLALAGGNTRVDRLEIDGANDYIDVSTDLQIVAAADIKLDPAGGEVVVDGNIVPDTDSTDTLGAIQTTVSTSFASYYQSQTVTSATEFISLQSGSSSDGIASAAVGDAMTLSDGSSTLTATVDVAYGSAVSQTGQWHDGNSGGSPSTMNVASPSGQIVFSYSSLPQRLKDCIGGAVVFGDSSNKLNGVVSSVNTSSNTVTIGSLSNNQGSGTLSMSSINQSELTCRGFGISSVSFSAGSSLALSGGVSSGVLRGSLKAWSSVVADNIRIPGTGLMYFDADQNSSMGSTANDVLTVAIGGSAKLSMTSAMLAPATADGYALGGTSNEWSDLYLADSSVIKMGLDQDVTLTHVPDAGILLNAAMKLQFRDASEFVHSDADGYMHMEGATGVSLAIAGTDELAVTATESTFGGNIALPDNGTVGNASIAAMLTLAASNVTVASGADFTIAKTSGLVLGSTAVTALGSELNLLDAGSAGSSVALVDADSFIMGDASASNQTKKVLMSDIKTYVGGGRSKKSMTVANAVSSGVKFPMLGVDNDGGADADLSDIYLNGQLMLSGTAASNGDYKIHGSLSEASSSSFSLASSPSSYSASSSSLTLQSSLTAVNAAKLSVGTVLKYTDSSSNVGLATVTAEPASGASSVSVSIVMSTGSSFSQSASTVTITESLRNGVVFFFALEVDDVVTQVNV